MRMWEPAFLCNRDANVAEIAKKHQRREGFRNEELFLVCA